MSDVAAFDFDGTISRRDTLVPFLFRTAGPVRFTAACTRLGLRATRGRITLRDRDTIKEQMVELLLADRSEDELRDLGERYARRLLSGDDLRPQMVERVRRHHEAGHRTVIVSASLVYYLEPVARALSIDGVIGVDPEVRNGRLTGRLARPNVRAEQKALRLEEWMGLEPSGTAGPTARVHGYGNSSGDHELLALADVAWWLGKPNRTPPGAVLFRPDAPIP